MYTMGDNSIFKKAQEAKEKTENAIKKEQEDLANLVNMLNEEYGGGTQGEQKPQIGPEKKEKF